MSAATRPPEGGARDRLGGDRAAEGAPASGPAEPSGAGDRRFKAAALWRDTLFKRLFLLMWAALVGSHLAAYTLVHVLHAPPARGAAGAPPERPGLPPMPSLPPGGPMPHLPPGDVRTVAPGGPPPGLPAAALWLDYAVRVLVMGLAAWFGARWLTGPVRRLSAASAELADGLRQRRPEPALDEATGTAEVRQAARVFNTMARQLREQFDAQALLMASISHDLRTPLTRLRLRLDTLPDPATAAACITDLHAMDALIGSVLQMIRAQQQHLPPRAVDLSALLQALVDDLAELGHDVHLSPVADPPLTTAVVRADPQALHRVFDNLLGNAVRHGRGAVVGLVLQGRQLAVTIDDHGPGIPAAELEAVFRPFYRVATPGGAASEGSGLGLYIARDLIERAGGRIELTNRLHGGLRARVTLPLAD